MENKKLRHYGRDMTKLIQWLGILYLVVGAGLEVNGAIASMGEPDWSISKAEVVQELYSYEPHFPRSLFPLFRAPLPAASSHRLQVLPTPTPPKYTKFSMQDKKDQPPQPQSNQNLQSQPPRYLPPVPLNNNKQKPSLPIGPVYEHPTVPSPTPTPTPIPIKQEPHQFPGGYPDATSVDRQTILWPENMEQGLQMSGDETALRFVVHKAGDEGEIKKALVEDGADRGQDVKFIEGPTLRIQRLQKVYLPPKKKTVVYILLKEPQIMTDVEVIGPTEEPVPEVFITYQRSDGGVRTKHYSPEVVKGDKYLRELGSSLVEGNHVGTRSISSEQQTQQVMQQHQEVTRSGPSSSSSNTTPLKQPLLCPSSEGNSKTKDQPHQTQITH